ncbi:MAG: DNA-directed RNA polymerase subunit H [Candidatus Heimdallarchaeaceae archaeon]
MAKSKESQQHFNIMKHELVPEHKIMTEEEKKQLFKEYAITPDQLPQIMNDDPVCVSIGAKSGQIIKIIRKSHTAGEAVVYRLVVESNK